MATIPLRVTHPTDSTHVDGQADLELTLRDVLIDLQRGEWLPKEQKLQEIVGVLERTSSTLPATEPLGKLGVVANDTIQLQKQTTAA